MTMPESSPARSPEAANLAVSFRNVSKEYRLYGSPVDRILGQTGIDGLLFWRPRVSFRPFRALNHLNLSIGHGERVGIIGRNGAGKTTLLKLITENFAPTEGEVEVNGSVQALMQLGIGFHPEFSGYDNIKAALNYNGLVGSAFKDALEDVIDFVELGDFLHQPLKTYSLGMGARLQFATATAIRPDILIVDEVMGAGDAYFTAKSAHRMEKLTSEGCTLLLVSHSTSQIMQFCKRGIFLHEGSVQMDGPVLDVVKSYEEFIADLTHQENDKHRFQANDEAAGARPPQKDFPTPAFQREQLNRLLVEDGNALTSSDASSRVSRWQSEAGLRLARVEVLDRHGRATGMLQSGEQCTIEVDVVAEETQDFSFRLAFLVMSMEGIGLVRSLSEQYSVSLVKGEQCTVRLIFEHLLLAKGEFVFSAALFKRYDAGDASTAIRYDVVPRSFKVTVAPVRRSDPAILNHPAKWELMAIDERSEHF